MMMLRLSRMFFVQFSVMLSMPTWAFGGQHGKLVNGMGRFGTSMECCGNQHGRLDLGFGPAWEAGGAGRCGLDVHWRMAGNVGMCMPSSRTSNFVSSMPAPCAVGSCCRSQKFKKPQSQFTFSAKHCGSSSHYEETTKPAQHTRDWLWLALVFWCPESASTPTICKPRRPS